MALRRVVYIDSQRQETPDWSEEERILAAADAELVLAQCTTDEEVVEAAASADGLLNSMYYMNAALFERLPQAKVVVRGGVGFDNLDVEACTKQGIVVCNVIDYAYNEVANHAFAMLMALNRKLVAMDRAVRDGTRRPKEEVLAHTGRLAGQTLGLCSFGNIAQGMARRARGFDMEVIAYDPYVSPVKAAEHGVELVELEDLLARSDFLSIHTPLSSETRGLIGQAQIALMRPGAFIIVTSRGGIVDEPALALALEEKRLGGAGIDVWEHEPVEPTNPLLQFDNVLASSHLAWWSEISPVILRRRMAEAAADVLRGVMPRSVVNPAVLAGISLAPRGADSPDDDQPG